MSLVFRKVRAIQANNGAFRQAGLLLMDDNGRLWYATNASNIPFNLSARDEENRPGVPVSHAAVLRFADSPAPFPISFATIVRQVADGSYFPELRGFRLILEGDALEASGVLDLDDILGTVQSQAVEAAALVGGVAIKQGYTRDHSYSGFASYHGHSERRNFNRPVQADRPWRIGIELEVYARTQAAKNAITSATSNWFMCERDGSLHERINGVSDLGVEIKTIPLKACDAKSVDFWEEPMARLAQLAVSRGHSTTGLHVHIGQEILGDTEEERRKTLTKLQLFYVYMVEDNAFAHQKNVLICGREHGYQGSLAEAKSNTLDGLKRLAKDSDVKNMLPGLSDDAKSRIGSELRKDNHRWDINTAPLSSYHTVEFRKADGRISKTRLAAVVTWWEQMVLYCRNTEWHELDFNAFFRKVTSENPCVAYFFNEDEEC